MIDIAEMKKKCDERDPSLAVFMVRDLPEVEAAGLKDLAWCLCYECTRNDALNFFELLEAALHPAAEQRDAKKG